MLEHEMQGLVLKIEKAFRNVPFPGNKIAYHGNEFELDDFLGKRWQDINPAHLHSSALIFFTLEAFHYYLPAFLIAIIKTPDKINFMTVENLIKKLSFADWTKKRIHKLFTKQQKVVIKDFLNNCKSLYPDHYWESSRSDLQAAVNFWTDF